MAGGRDLEHPPLAVQVGLAGCHGTFTILVLINDLLWQSMQPATSRRLPVDVGR